jgi:Flp pilus assembly protein protease CpaA
MLLVLVIISLIALIVASVIDLKTREVPDWLNYSLIFAGLGIRLIYSIVEWEISFFLYGFLGFAIMFVLAYLMYYTGQWGGGDSKMMMGLGAMIGFDLSLRSTLLAFLILIIFAGSFYGFIYSIIIAIRNKSKFIPRFNELKEKHHNIRRIIISICALLIIISFFMDVYLRIVFLGFAFIILLTFYMFMFYKAVESVCMIKKVEPEELTEGDWIVDDIMVNKKRICGPKDLGISKEQIAKLINLKKNKKVNKILIKEGIPFVPSFLLAYLIILFLNYKGIDILNLFI